MYKSLFPFILASLGFALIVLATAVMPLFEWQISGITTDFPSTYEVVPLPSPWMAKLGDSFDDGSYVYRKVFVSKAKSSCLKEDLNFVTRRSQNDKALERAWLNIKKNFSWLFGWSLIEVVLSGIYIFWFGLWYGKGSAGLAVQTFILLGIAACFFLFLTQLLRLEGPLFPTYYSGRVDCYPGTVTFNARLSKIHYETLLVLLVGILADLGALGVMLRKIIRAVLERQRDPNL